MVMTNSNTDIPELAG